MPVPLNAQMYSLAPAHVTCTLAVGECAAKLSPQASRPMSSSGHFLAAHDITLSRMNSLL
jgi:hypothetical protein